MSELVVWEKPVQVPAVPSLLNIFIMKGFSALSSAFSASIEMIIFFPFVLLMWFVSLIVRLFIPGINLTWSWCVVLLICCWIWFASILLRTFHKACWSLVFLFL